MKLSKEQRFLLNVFRNDVQSKSRIKEILGGSLDWDWILRFAEYNRIWSLLYNKLKKFNQKSIPDHIMKKLEGITLYTASQNLLIEHETKKLLERLNEKNICVIMLKGLSLQKKIYANKIVRPMADVDLLVKEEDLLRVEQVLLDHGFVFDVRRTSKEECLKKGEHDFPYMKKGTRTMVEVHWHLVDKYNPFEIKMEDIWRRAKKTGIGGADTLTLSLEDILIYQCLHVSFQHVFFSAAFRDIVDVSEIVKRFCDEIDWSLLVKTCVEWKTEAFVYYILNLVKKMLNAPVPDVVLENLKKNSSKAQLFGLMLVDESHILEMRKFDVEDRVKFVFLELLWTNSIEDKVSITRRVLSKIFR